MPEVGRLDELNIMKRIVPILFVLSLSACGLLKPNIGKVIETWQAENQNLKLRIVMRQENCFAVCGAYYTFLSAPVGSDSWREIFTTHHDDPDPIPRENVRFINSQIAYVFFGPKYAVTTDAGKSWVEWDAWEANKSIRFAEYRLYPSIVEVSVTSDGRGKMRLYPIGEGAADQPELLTTDYGRNWSLG